MALSGSRKVFLEAVAQENRTTFGGWVHKDHVRETLELSHNEADIVASDLVRLGYLQAQGFGNLDIRLSQQGLSAIQA